MRLYLAVATFMLVLIAHSEAVEEPTIEQRFTTFQEKVVEFGETLGDKATNVWKDFENSEFRQKATSWFTEQFERIKQKLDDTFNKPE